MHICKLQSLLFAIFLVYVAALPADDVQTRRSSSPSLGCSVGDLKYDSTDANVQCHVHDQIFDLALSLDFYKGHESCLDVDLHVNGRWIGQRQTPTGWERVVEDDLNRIPARSTKDLGDHNLNIDAYQGCLSPDPSVGSKSGLGYKVITIRAVNGHAISEDVGIVVIYENLSKRILSIEPLSYHVTPSTTSSPHGIELPKDIELPQKEKVEESRLIAETISLKELIRQKDEKIRLLERIEAAPTHCKSVKAFASNIYTKIRDCAETMCEKLKSATGSIFDKVPSTKGFMANIATDGERIIGHGSSSTVSAESFEPNFQREHSERESTRRHVLIALGMITSALCCGCLTLCIRSKCCNPRARAERAARREERNTARAYRRLARQQAWKNWWSRQRLGGWRSSEPRTSDYEEKRGLILGQEAILEAAMQEQIRRLEEEGGVQHHHRHHRRGRSDEEAAEEGRAGPAALTRTSSREGSDVLPAYRSRAASNDRPPSYHSYDPHARFTAADGTSSGDRSSDVVIVTDESDVTPDSSIANISPRLSFETIRTERSFC